MPIRAQSADGVWHNFEDGTEQPVIDKVMKQYAASTGKIPQQDQMGPAGRFMTGVGDIGVGAHQLYANTFQSPQRAQEVNKQVQTRETEIQRREGGGVMRALGEAAPAMLAAPIAGEGILAGTLGGVAAGATQPVTSTGDYWNQKQDDVLFGAAFGGGSTAALKTIGAALSGVSDPAKKALVQSGVQLTPGQLGGGVVRRAEEAFKSFPILGNFIRGAEGRGIEGFNKGVLNQALEPIGQKLDPMIPAGPQAIAKTQEMLSAAYDKLLPQLRLKLDPDLSQALQDVRNSAQELPRAQTEQFETILNNRLGSYFKSTPLDPAAQGAGVKRTMSDLRAIADKYRSSSVGSEREMARHLDNVSASLRAALERQNPQLSQQLKNIDYGWAMFARAQQAATRRATSEQIFTPADLLQVVKSQDKTARHGKFSTGDALLQVYAQYGQKILPGKMPDSGTTERALYDAAVIAAKPAYAVMLGAASAPYTKAGMGMVNKAAQGLSPGVGSVVRKAAPYAGIGLGGLGTQPTEDRPYGGPQQ